ncbi:MAG: murein biosynthesis integral membrane protein MurJ [Phycisphaeraceae bacterium]
MPELSAPIDRPALAQPPALRWLPRAARWTLAVYWPALIVATHWPRISVDTGLPEVISVDKLAHGVAFAILTALLILARPLASRIGRARAALLAVAVALAYGVLEELTQPLVGRTLDPVDLLADLAGILGAYLALAPRRRGPWTPAAYTARGALLLFAPPLLVLTLLPRGNVVIPQIIHHITDPHATTDLRLHFYLSLALTWLLALAAPAGLRRPRLGALVTCAAMIGSAPVIELIQDATGRAASPADVFAHEKGVLAAMVGWSLLVAAAAIFRRPAPALAGDAEEPAGPAGTDPPRSGSRFVGHALVVGSLTLLSRFTGLGRDMVLAAAFGASAITDAFFLGFLVPNLFRRLFGEGALAASFIPQYAAALKEDRQLAARFAGLCLALLTCLLAVLTLVGEGLLAGMLSAGGWSPATELALRLTMIMLPYMPLVCLVALFGAVLQVHGRFAPAAAAPILLNMVIVAFASWGAWGGGAELLAGAGPLEDIARQRWTAELIAWGVLLAGTLQLVWQVLAARQVTTIRIAMAGTRERMHAMIRTMGPMLIGLAVFQINAFLDSLIAFGLAGRGGATHFTLFGQAIDYPMESGAVGVLQWAQRLYQFPLGVFGIAVAAAIFPALSSAAADSDEHGPEPFRRILRQGLRLTLFIGLPASVGLILLRLPLTRIMFERGEFTPADSLRVASILAGYAASVWAYSMMHVATRAFYARHDARTPLRVSLIAVAVNLTLNMTLIWKLGAAGLAWSTAISGSLQAVLLTLALRKRGDRPVDASVWQSWTRTAGLTAAMALPLGIAMAMLNPAELSQPVLVGVLAGGVAIGGTIFLGGAWLLGAEELRWLKRRG